jgi:hypothetical protein
MADTILMDRVYQYVLNTMVERGNAPHYTEIAKAFSVDPEGGKALLHELVETGIPAWLYPDTDYIVSFAPFHNLPTQYRISVDGRRDWYGQ